MGSRGFVSASSGLLSHLDTERRIVVTVFLDKANILFIEK
jgi:hypothetical protein